MNRNRIPPAELCAELIGKQARAIDVGRRIRRGRVPAKIEVVPVVAVAVRDARDVGFRWLERQPVAKWIDDDAGLKPVLFHHHRRRSPDVSAVRR